MDFFMPFQLFRFVLFLLIAFPCALSDYRTGLIPRFPLLFLVVLMIATSIYGEYPFLSFQTSVFGAGAGMGIFYTTRKLTGNGLGLADVWMAGAIGALGGFALCLKSTFLAIVFIYLFRIRLNKKTSFLPIPFVPGLLAGCVFFIFFPFFGAVK